MHACTSRRGLESYWINAEKTQNPLLGSKETSSSNLILSTVDYSRTYNMTTIYSSHRALDFALNRFEI